MTMLEMIMAAQGGSAMGNLGQQFGLDQKQAEQAVRALLPALSSGIKRNTAKPDGLAAFLEALNRPNHERYVDDPNMLSDAATMQDGNAILGHILGSKDVSRAAVQRASSQTGIGQEILKQMLPIIASIIMGALTKSGRNPLNDILGEILGGGRPSGGQRQAPQGDNPFGDLADIIKGGAPTEGPAGSNRQADAGTAPQGKAPPSAIDIFGSMLDADGDGSAMDDIFDMMTKGAR